jgi:penicillin-binding protein 2
MFYSQNNVTTGQRNVFYVLIVAVFLLLAARLYQLQIVLYNRFVGMADANRIRVVSQEAPRGIIYDRNGDIIVDNQSRYNISVIPYELQRNREVYTILSGILRIPESELRERVKRNWRGQLLAARVAEDVDFVTLAELEERRLELPGVIYSLQPIRSFPSNANLSQVLGYLREVDKNDLQVVKDYGYRAGDYIGWNGVEREYENILRGTRGVSYVQVNVYGQEVGSIQDKRRVQSRIGNDLYLTIDLELQRYAESLLDGHKGAIIIMDADNGEIYTMVSKPDYLPNLFSGIVESDIWDKLRNDPDKPLYNRAIQGTYPAGSTFKVVAAIAALERKVIDPKATFYCRGGLRLGRREFKCWKSSGHGRMDLNKAIINSCNVYFYNLIQRMDIDVWADYAKKFKFGKCTGIDLYGESQGVIPDRAFLDRKYGLRGWTEGNKLNLVIGQGDLIVTPIQMLRLIASIGTRGKLPTPHVGLKYFDRSKNHFFPLNQTHPDSISDIHEATWDMIQSALYDVVNSSNGTGRAARTKGLDIYGKTGTAQNPHGEDHSWFIGFLKSEGRTMALTVLVEHGGSGGGEAAKISGNLFRFIHNQIKSVQVVVEE